MGLFYLTDTAYTRKFDLTKLTEMYLQMLEDVQPQTQVNANKASLEFFKSMVTGSAIRGLSWSQIKDKDLYIKCYIHLFVRTCADLQPRSKQDWMDVCTLLIHDVPLSLVDTVLDSYAAKKARFWAAPCDQSADKAQWFVAYFKYLRSIELLEHFFADYQAQPNGPDFTSDLLAFAATFDVPGYKFTAVQLKMALDKLNTHSFHAFLAELLYLVTELQ